MMLRPTTFDELMAVQHLAAINVTGAHLPALAIEPRGTLFGRSADVGTRAFRDANDLAGRLRIRAIATLPPLSPRNQTSDTQRSTQHRSRPDAAPSGSEVRGHRTDEFCRWGRSIQV